MPQASSDPLGLCRPLWREVDLAALGRNYDALRRAVGPLVHIIAPVKAEAYGHGAVAVARYLAARDVYALETASFCDACAIRSAGVRTKIIMFAGNLPAGASALLEHDLTPTVLSVEGAAEISAIAQVPTNIHVKVDSGLARLGAPLLKAERLIVEIAGLRNIVIEGIYTHVPFSSTGSKTWAQSRIRDFERLVERLANAGISVPIAQARSSSHVLTGITDRLNAISTGHILYGINPLKDQAGLDSRFEPVFRSLKAQLIQVKDSGFVPYGEAGPHDQTYRSVTRTGVVLLGLANGLRQPAPGTQALALVRGQRARVLSISLEYTVVDLSLVEEARVGDVATFLGRDGEEEIDINQVAAWQGVSPLEFLVGLQKIPTRYSS